MIEVVLASTNLHKIRELRLMCKSMPKIDWLSLHSFPNYEQPEETGETLEENAILKAVHAARELNAWVLADDSGLFVPSLQGAPGVHSRNYAGKNASDIDNRAKLLAEMGNLIDPVQRQAYYQCSLALASPGGLKKCVIGTCEGYVLCEERGNNGFGYDSLFIKHDYDKTFAELEEGVKSRISHRYKAFEKLIPILESL